MPKKKRPFIFTVSRARMVETMTAHRKSPEEIADALGCTTEMVVDYLLGQVGTEHEAADDRLFFMAAMAGGRGVAMASGYHVTVGQKDAPPGSGYHVTVSAKDAPKDDPASREWVETNEAKVVSERVRDYLKPRLPEGWTAHVSPQYEERNPAWGTFDDRRLREPANAPPDAPKEQA